MNAPKPRNWWYAKTVLAVSFVVLMYQVTFLIGNPSDINMYEVLTASVAILLIVECWRSVRIDDIGVTVIQRLRRRVVPWVTIEDVVLVPDTTHIFTTTIGIVVEGKVLRIKASERFRFEKDAERNSLYEWLTSRVRGRDDGRS